MIKRVYSKLSAILFKFNQSLQYVGYDKMNEELAKRKAILEHSLKVCGDRLKTEKYSDQIQIIEQKITEIREDIAELNLLEKQEDKE
jgi:predicted RNA-binding protein